MYRHVGKVLIAALLSGIQFARIVGIEVLPALCAAARKLLLDSRLHSAQDAYNSGTSRRARPLPPVEVREGDMLLLDWSDADLVYLASTCFPDTLMQTLLRKFAQLKAGAVVLCLSVPDHFAQTMEMAAQEWVVTSVGRVRVFVLMRSEV